LIKEIIGKIDYDLKSNPKDQIRQDNFGSFNDGQLEIANEVFPSLEIIDFHNVI